MKRLILLVRILAGMVFIFSGFVKGIDVTGSAIKFEEYFEAFHLEFLHLLVLPLTFLMPLLEFMIGVSLLFNLKPRAGIWGFLLFMALFTPLTFILALFNPVSDCGCFGDALVLTNWQTFYKNLLLLLFALVLYAGRNQLTGSHTPFREPLLLSLFALFFITISLYSYNHLPLIDFRPYRVGTNIPEQMTIPEDAPHDEYKTILIYEKDGVQKEFPMDNFPWQDTTWKFVDQKTTLIKKGYTPPIHDFSITMPGGTDITDYILGSQGYTFLLLSSNFSKANVEALKNAVDLYVWSQDHDIPFYVVTPSPVESALALFNTPYPIPWTNIDETTCKTIIRSNPGLLLLKEGTILAKWHYHDLPAPTELKDNLLAYSITSLRKQADIRLILLLIATLLLTAALGTMEKRRKR